MSREGDFPMETSPLINKPHIRRSSHSIVGKSWVLYVFLFLWSLDVSILWSSQRVLFQLIEKDNSLKEGGSQVQNVSIEMKLLAIVFVFSIVTAIIALPGLCVTGIPKNAFQMKWYVLPIIGFLSLLKIFSHFVIFIFA